MQTSPASFGSRIGTVHSRGTPVRMFAPPRRTPAASQQPSTSPPRPRTGASAQLSNAKALVGGTYKAVTFALRAGYATTQEKIAKGVSKITELLKGVKDNTAEMADGMDFNVLP